MRWGARARWAGYVMCYVLYVNCNPLQSNGLLLLCILISWLDTGDIFKTYGAFCVSSCAVYCWCVDVLMCVDVCWCVLVCSWVSILILIKICVDFCVLCLLLCILISWLDTGGVLRCMLCFAFQVVLCIADVLVLMCWCVLMCVDVLCCVFWYLDLIPAAF